MPSLRDPKCLDDPPPDYGPESGQITLNVHYGGRFQTEQPIQYLGGSLHKFDYVEIRFVSLGGIRQLSEYVGLVGEKRYYTKTAVGFTQILSTTDLRAVIFCQNIPVKEIDIYIVCDVEFCGSASQSHSNEQNTHAKDVSNGYWDRLFEGISSSSGDDSDYVYSSCELDFYDDVIFSVYTDDVSEDRNERIEEIANVRIEGVADVRVSKTEGAGVGESKKIGDGEGLSKTEALDRGELQIEERLGDDLQSLSGCDFSDSEFDLGNEVSDYGNDDSMFDKAVDVEAEWAGAHLGGELQQEGSAKECSDDGSEDILLSEADFLSDVGSDGEGAESKLPVFNPSTLYYPNFSLGMIFSSKKHLRLAIHSHAIKTKRNIRITKNDKIRLHAKCAENECDWRLHATKRVDENTYQVRDYVSKHKCAQTFHVKNMSSGWLSGKYKQKFMSDPNRSVNGFRVDAIKDLRCNITKSQAYRTKRKAMDLIEGAPEEQYKLLWDYINEVKRTNPGSTLIMGTDQSSGENRFDRFYVCLHALKVGFLSGCRPLIGVDGCHLKGPYGGVLLSAVGIDPNNKIFPIAYAIVKKENHDTWDWFLTLLKLDLKIEEPMSWTFMSDKQKGLLQALWNVFPSADFRHCVRHLHSNFRNAGYRGAALKTALWNAAMAITPNEFRVRMKEMSDLDESAAAWFNDKPAYEWSKAHFSTYPRCDLLLNNGCECFNSIILEARDKHILSLLMWIMEYLMKRMQQNRDRANNQWKGPFCPKIQKIIQRNMDKQADCIPIKSDDDHYQISCFDGSQYSVDLKERTCGCRKWDLSGIPCKHAISAIICQGLRVEDFTHRCYRLGTYRKVYANAIIPINGRMQWEKTEFIPPMPPVNLGRATGRPRKARRREPDEVVIKTKKRAGGKPVFSKTSGGKLKRQQNSLKCGKCKQSGHNARTCPGIQVNPNHPGNDEYDAEFEEAVNEYFSQITMDTEAPFGAPFGGNIFGDTTQPKEKLQVRKNGSENINQGSPLKRRKKASNLPNVPLRRSPRKVQSKFGTQESQVEGPAAQETSQTAQSLENTVAPTCSHLKEPTLKPGPSMFKQFQDGLLPRERGERKGKDSETPSIVRGGVKFVTLVELQDMAKKKDEGKGKQIAKKEN